MNTIINKVYADSLSDYLSGQFTDPEGGTGSFFEVSGNNALGDFASNVIGIAMPLAGIAAVILLTIAGYQMITSQGNPDKLKEAKEMITNAIIGLVFILLSVSILLFLTSIFNLNTQG